MFLVPISMDKCSEVLAFINPIFFYYSLVYVISKCFQLMLSSQSIWQRMWNKIVDEFGDDPETFTVWFMLGYAYSLYWILGIIFTLMEESGKPEGLKEFKIQPYKGQRRDVKRFGNVSYDLISCQNGN